MDRLNRELVIKQEAVDTIQSTIEGQRDVSTQPQQSAAVPRCPNAIKKEEEKEGEIKLKLDDDDDKECTCKECTVEREIKTEFNQVGVCKCVKKEEQKDDENDDKWDSDCGCRPCRRMSEKAMWLEQTNRTMHENQITDSGDLAANAENGGAQACADAEGGDGESDGEETELEDEEDQNDQLMGDDGESAVNGQVGGENVENGELEKQGELWEGGPERGENIDESEDDETELDDEEYDMEVDDDEASDAVETDSDYEPEVHLPRNSKIKCTWKSCTKTYARKNSMLRHYKTHTGGLAHVCEQCGRAFNLRIHLTRHARQSHPKRRPFECTWNGCTKTYIQKVSLQNHMSSHTGERSFQCSRVECGHESLIAHQATEWRCDKCYRRYPTHRKLYYHHRRYHQTGQFRCALKNQCAFVGSTRDELYKHNMAAHAHSGGSNRTEIQNPLTPPAERQFACPIPQCGLSFGRKTLLNRHQRIHTRIKSYRCRYPDCGYASVVSYAAVTHIRTVHYNLPATLKEQRERGIVDDRDPKDLLQVCHELLD